jgi:recombination protein RecA
MQLAASCQEEGGIILYLDSEHSLDAEYCKKIGLNIEDPGFIIVQEETADSALTTALRILAEGVVDLIIVDSLANLMPEAVYEKIMEKGVGAAVVGNKARLLTQFMESAIGLAHRQQVAVVCTQQMRTVMKPGLPPRETSASPNSVKHNTSLRAKVSRKKDNEGEGKKTDETYQGKSQETIVRIEKNKVGPPFRQALYQIEYGVGVLYWDDLLDCCTVHGVKNVVQGGKFTIVDDNGEILGKFYRKGAEEFFRNPENRDAAIMLVDKLSDAVGIHLWDPLRGSTGRRIGPYTSEEIEACGGTLIDGIDFEESVPDEEVAVL